MRRLFYLRRMPLCRPFASKTTGEQDPLRVTHLDRDDKQKMHALFNGSPGLDEGDAGTLNIPFTGSDSQAVTAERSRRLEEEF